MELLLSQAPPANNNTTLALFIGKTKDEQLICLQSLKDAMADVLIQSLAEDLMICDSTSLLLQGIYMQADSQLKMLQRNKFKD